jgi:hypothetical protein
VRLPALKKMTFYEAIKFDGLVTTRKRHYFVIPVETGIQHFQWVTGVLDTRFRWYD